MVILFLWVAISFHGVLWNNQLLPHQVVSLSIVLWITLMLSSFRSHISFLTYMTYLQNSQIYYVIISMPISKSKSSVSQTCQTYWHWLQFCSRACFVRKASHQICSYQAPSGRNLHQTTTKAHVPRILRYATCFISTVWLKRGVNENV